MSAFQLNKREVANGLLGETEDKTEKSKELTAHVNVSTVDGKQPENTTVIENDNPQQTTAGAPPPAASASDDAKTTSTTTTLSCNQYSDQPQLDVECERLLRNAKRQVKRMMEEAVTKKFIHEDSSSIIALCVSIDACLSYGLKRRALGLFKTNSSTALVQKCAKFCPDAQKIIELVEAEERRQEEELKLIRKQSQSEQPGNNQSANKQQQQQQQPIKVASNLGVHRRNLWLKCALMEKKLVPIVEHLAENASKYYEPEALMANCLTAQLLCSLLAGACALEFSRSKTNDYYQFEDPTAEELLKRHKLSNPIACLGSASACAHQHASGNSSSTPNKLISRCQSASLNQKQHQRSQILARSKTDNNNNANRQSQTTRRNRSATTSETSSTSESLERPRTGARRLSLSNNELADGNQQQENRSTRPSSPSTSGGGGLARVGSRRRPLALKTNVRTGALVTECHHYCCQDINEHQQTRGYSLLSATSAATNVATINAITGSNPHSNPFNQQQPQQCNGTHTSNITQGNNNSNHSSSTSTSNTLTHCGNQPNNRIAGQQEAWPVWSPRMLHETLHQNSKSSLLYAKNNVLLETQAHGTMAGYLSLHQTSNDLILKWIPNQLINGGHPRRQPASEVQLDCAKQHSCPSESCAAAASAIAGTTLEEDRETAAAELSAAADQQQLRKSSLNGTQRAHSLDNVNIRRRRQNEQAETSRVSNDLDDDDDDDQSEGQADEPEWAPAQAPVGGSYLDLVVSLSVSRIVLLHCHFGARLAARNQPLDQQQQQQHSDDLASDERVISSPDETPRASVQHNELLDLVDSSGHQSDCGEQQQQQQQQQQLETLILVEADGVQRAPFKFPKGGLRWFLSCLESGLRPNKYLEPAMKLDQGSRSSTGESSSAAAGCRQALDPNELINPTGAELPVAAAAAAALNELATSRLDVLLRRLPSLRRRSADKAKASGDLQNSNTANSSQADSRVSSPSPGVGEPLQRIMPSNYVYRIVSVDQPDWLACQTPPHSATSNASNASSGSVAPIDASGGQTQTQTRAKQVRQQRSDPNSGKAGSGDNKFRWSLSRLARFSSRAGSSSSSSIGGGLITSNGGGGDTPQPEAADRQSTIETSLASLDDDVASSSSLQANYGSSAATAGSCQQKISNMKRDSSSELIRIETKLNSLKKTSSDELLALRDKSILTLCEKMRKQILARAFYGWLAYCRRRKIIKNHLEEMLKLGELARLNDDDENGVLAGSAGARQGLTRQKWEQIMATSWASDEEELARTVNRLVYYGGVESNELRVQVWPYLLGHYQFKDTPQVRQVKDEASRAAYEQCGREWIKIERVIARRDRDILAANMAKAARRQAAAAAAATAASDGIKANGQVAARPVSETTDDELIAASKPANVDEMDEISDFDEDEEDLEEDFGEVNGGGDGDEDLASSYDSKREPPKRSDKRQSMSENYSEKDQLDSLEQASAEPTADVNDGDSKLDSSQSKFKHRQQQQQLKNGRRRHKRRRYRLESTGSVGSDASITDQFGNNIHRIDKDVQRCDRNFWYFKEVSNLDKLRNIMCTYVWQHLDVGYVQGMCDLVAPFLVVFDDELQAYNCFSQLMKRMVANFPHGSAMDKHFESLKYLMQVLDPKLFEVLQSNGDYTHFYFCYRWLLLDFKRELAYEDVYRVWETIWAARQVATDHFVVFLALAMVRYYRDIIIENNMDFTDTIKFFNEMAERHDIKRIIALAQDSIVELESLIKD